MSYYDILGVNSNASDNDIKKAYRKLAKKYHPDRHSNSSDDVKKEAEDKFKDISKAYNTLSDPDKKKQYDMFGEDGPQFSSSSGNSGGMSMEDLFNMMNGGNGFNPFNNGFNPFRGNTQINRLRVPNITNTIQINRSDAIKGTTIEFTVNKYVLKNTNIQQNMKLYTCDKCDGAGNVIQITKRGNMMSQTMRECRNCNKGFVFNPNVYRSEAVTFRKKIKPGTFVNRICIKNKGHDIPKCLLKSNSTISKSMVVLDIKIVDDINTYDNGFNNNPFNISTNVNVDLIDVLQGNTVEVTDCYDQKINLVIPKDLFFVKNYEHKHGIIVVPDHGVKVDNNALGDLYVFVNLNQTEFNMDMFNDDNDNNINDDNPTLMGMNYSNYKMSKLKETQFMNYIRNVENEINTITNETISSYI